MFGLGWAEIIVLVLCGFAVVGGTIVAIVLTQTMGRKPRRSDESSELSELREENRRLRDENERLRSGLKKG